MTKQIDTYFYTPEVQTLCHAAGLPYTKRLGDFGASSLAISIEVALKPGPDDTKVTHSEGDDSRVFENRKHGAVVYLHNRYLIGKSLK